MSWITLVWVVLISCCWICFSIVFEESHSSPSWIRFPNFFIINLPTNFSWVLYSLSLDQRCLYFCFLLNLQGLILHFFNIFFGWKFRYTLLDLGTIFIFLLLDSIYLFNLNFQASNTTYLIHFCLFGVYLFQRLCILTLLNCASLDTRLRWSSLESCCRSFSCHCHLFSGSLDCSPTILLTWVTPLLSLLIWLHWVFHISWFSST